MITNNGQIHLSVDYCPNVTVEWTEKEGEDLLGPPHAKFNVAVAEVILKK